ncbi:Peptidoglycan/LPS O-acetylase OafA/YrhL, contains acyltransferase and SGNH-hydrolase domains [Rathayibacter oskolensis]|uniref:Peptidoglycan/LPS O-acetylase OafA/YrhL, contains acyltransferase and SGNH-hydrolase domains n=1 Tax=Rathayibacter oskolensis TaxID=1891671 RepID=A0A1X7PG78_9MICO|nr:acyltransferase [Rathayibacter oskolensis]SMH50511.1 Peptidoglycan/LPS O-acetylase OafA/YrhL, contains acyltransferase and SGNH-hydrolase domains [Rathayibacter oskolensis]
MGRCNDFDAVRLAAALAVIVGHGFVLLGEPAPRLLGLPLHSLGVSVFFCVSGYLVAGSAERAPSVGRFLRHRVLRIVPALAVVVVVTMLVIGPLASSLPLGAYLASGETWAYGLNLLLLAQYELPGVFDSSAHARPAVNGSLWTLGVEFCCYLAVLSIRFAPAHRRGALAVAGLVGTVALTLVGGAIGAAAELCAFFAAAAALRLLVPAQWLRWPSGTAAAVVLLAAAGTPLQPVALWVALPVVVVAVGTGSTPLLRRAARWGDLSYGLYLWAYPVQQLVIDRAGRLPVLPNLALVLAITLVVALGSWWLIERPALRFKDAQAARV